MLSDCYTSAWLRGIGVAAYYPNEGLVTVIEVMARASADWPRPAPCSPSTSYALEVLLMPKLSCASWFFSRDTATVLKSGGKICNSSLIWAKTGLWTID